MHEAKMEENESVTAIAHVGLKTSEGILPYLVVGTAKSSVESAETPASGKISVFKA